MDDLTRLAQGKYLSLTTFRKSGQGVATPVWLVREGDRLYVTTQSDSWKVKRLRNNPDVVLAPCDARGKILGPSVPGTAALLDDERSQHVRRQIQHRYGMAGRFIGIAQRLRGRSAPSIGIEIEVGTA